MSSGTQQPTVKDLFLIKSNGKYGYINKSGFVVIEPQFDKAANDFFEGLAPIAIGRSYGYIDESGSIAIEPQFDLTSDFSEGLAYVWTSGKYGYIDRTGAVVIAPQFDGAGKFSAGLAPVTIGGKPCLVNRAGHVIANPDPFRIVQKFPEGLAAVRVGDKFGYMDETQRVVIEPQFDEADDFSEGLAHVNIGGKRFSHYDRGLQGGEHFYIDKTGKRIIDANKCGISERINLATSFSEGMARICLVERVGSHTWSQSFVRSLFSSSSDGVPSSSTEVKWKYGYIDKAGKLAIKPQFDDAKDFHGGLASVNIGYLPFSYERGILSDGKWGYIDKSGEYVWRPTD